MDISTTPATLNMDILTTPATLRVVLKCFSDKLWERIESRDGDLKFRFDMAVKDLLGADSEEDSKSIDSSNEIKNKAKDEINEKVNDIKKKPKFPVPFYGHIVESWCFGIKKNHGLYTQCSKIRGKGEMYCKICAKQAMNNASGKPNCGDIRDRLNCWTGNLDYKPSGMTREVPYKNIMNKLNIDIDEANKVVNSLGWGDIPECHLLERKARRGRPKTKIVVEDSDDDSPKKKRGRPKKVLADELTNEELIEKFMSM